jgi:amino acid transporter
MIRPRGGDFFYTDDEFEQMKKDITYCKQIGCEGVVFGILSFIGFDAAATLGEETRDPKKNVPLAVNSALFAVGIFYVIVMYALTSGYGLNNHANLLKFLGDPNPFVTLGHHYAHWLLQPIELAAIAGLFSCFMAIHNTTVRVMFSMGRDQILPKSIGKVHKDWYSPYGAIAAQTAFTVVAGIAGGVWLGPGASGNYGFTGTIGTVAIVIVYCLSNIALIKYFWKRNDRNTARHIVIPVLGIIALAYPLWSVAKPGQSWPFSLVPWIVLGWLALGTALLLIYRKNSPEKINSLGQFINDDEFANHHGN